MVQSLFVLAEEKSSPLLIQGTGQPPPSSFHNKPQQGREKPADETCNFKSGFFVSHGDFGLHGDFDLRGDFAQMRSRSKQVYSTWQTF